MTCWRHRRWYVVSCLGFHVWGYDDNCDLDWLVNEPGANVFLFASLNYARKIALKEDGIVKFYQGDRRINQCDPV